MVGSALRWLRSDASDCFCMELTVCDVTREVDLGVLCAEFGYEGDPDFRFAKRCAVAGGKADICMGGMVTGSCFFGCAEDNVWE